MLKLQNVVPSTNFAGENMHTELRGYEDVAEKNLAQWFPTPGDPKIDAAAWTEMRKNCLMSLEGPVMHPQLCQGQAGLRHHNPQV